MNNVKRSLSDIKLTNDQQEIVDAANNGDMQPLLRYLNGALRATCKLSLEQVGHTSQSRIGLRAYYQNCMVTMIAQVRKASIRKSLEVIYLGDN